MLDQTFADAAKLMYDAWVYMPYGLLADLCAYHFLVRWLDRRSSLPSSPHRPE